MSTLKSRQVRIIYLTVSPQSRSVHCSILGDLKTRKCTGTLSCQIEIHFSSQNSKFLVKYNLLRFQISGGLVVIIVEHDYKVSTSFMKENKRYK